MDRVKFHSVTDMASGYYLKNCEKLIEAYEAGKEIQDINDVLELYNVKKYLDNKVHLLEWTPEQIKGYENTVNSYFGFVAQCIKSITNDVIIIVYNNVEVEYKNDFWELIDKFKAYNNISDKVFHELMTTSDVWLHQLLQHKNITEHFGAVIRDYMLTNPTSAELLLDKYEVKHFHETKPLYLPRILSNADKESIISNYINSENPNLNFIRLICNIQSNKDKLEISPKTLLRAKRKAAELEKQFFPEDSGIVLETTVSFSKTQEEEAIILNSGSSTSATYSTKWLNENKDYPTLLNNFIYLFGFVDNQMRFTLVSKLNEMGVFERLVGTTSQNAYKKGIAFDQKNVLALLQMRSYYHELNNIEIRLEEVIEWFFTEYLSSEFNARSFKINMPSSSSSFLEKCSTIAPAIESVLKQFTLFVQEGQIDFELLEVKSEQLIYKNIPTLVNKKYVYGFGNEYSSATYLLFSDQSGLGYTKKSKKEYSNFYELVCNKNTKLNDYPEHCLSQLDWLSSNKFISVDNQNNISFNKRLILILKDLYFNEVISYWAYSESNRNLIELLQEKGLVRFERSLFSKPEQDYINYTLNKSQFNNSLDLRNKYSHSQLLTNDSEEIHTNNYMIFLRLLILIIIKINNDFCISNELRFAKNEPAKKD